MNNSDLKFFIEVFVTLFVIMDPPGTIPLFLSLTSGRSHRMRKRAAWQAVTVAFFVITVFALFGQSILDYLGITLPAMQAAGGLLLLLVALELLTGHADEPEETTNVNVALVPLGTPLLAGPGAIVATIVFVRAGGRDVDGRSHWRWASSPYTSCSGCSCASRSSSSASSRTAASR